MLILFMLKLTPNCLNNIIIWLSLQSAALYFKRIGSKEIYLYFTAYNIFLQYFRICFSCLPSSASQDIFPLGSID